MTSESGGNGQVKVLLPYLARSPLYDKQKPYSTNFDVSKIPGAKQTNHVIQISEQTVHDLRQRQKEFNLEENGFQIVKEPTGLNYTNCNDETHIANKHRATVQAILHKAFPQIEKFVYLDHQKRIRSPLFPGSPGELVESLQPASMPHVDFTPRGSLLRMAQRFPKEDLAGKDFDLINVWQVLRGPNNDWPLAVCDYQSLDTESDCISNDVIHPNSAEENGLLFYNSQHRWYYLSDQEVDDLVVFRHSDSFGQRSKAFHAAFDTGVAGTQPRASLEMRFAAFYSK